jgi:mRNA interferase YafQ
MRTINQSSRFKRDFKREARGQHRQFLKENWVTILKTLANDEPLPAHLYDHPLSGDWPDFRDCHIRPDLILIYNKLGNDILHLARMGSHSELGL